MSNIVHFTDDGTITIPEHVQVFDRDGTYWFRHGNPQRWIAMISGSDMVAGDPARAAHVVIREEMARQRRPIGRWGDASKPTVRESTDAADAPAAKRPRRLGGGARRA